SASLYKDWGVSPAQVIDFQTLVGDAVDNVKGAPGIGPKTASKLLQDFGTLDNLLAHVDEIPGKKRDALKTSAAALATSRRLLTLKTGVDIRESWDQWRVGPWDASKLAELFRDLGFRRFTELVRSESPSNHTSNRARTGNSQAATLNHTPLPPR